MEPKETIAASEKARGAAACGRSAARPCCQTVLLARVGRGKRLHIPSKSGLTALCGRGPITLVVGTYQSMCQECAAVAAALPVRKCMVCGLEFRGEVCPAQTDFDANLGVYLHHDNPAVTGPQGTVDGVVQPPNPI